MDTLRQEAERAERVRRLMEEFGLPEDEAIFAVDLADGTHTGDIVGLPPSERLRFGLDREFDECAAERSVPTPLPVGVSSRGRRRRG